MSAPSQQPEVTFRVLPAEEWERLIPFFGDNAQHIPHPAMSAVVVGEADGEIVLAHVLQLVYHAEPLVIREDYRHAGLWRESTRMIEGLFAKGNSYYINTDNAAVKNMAEKNGMTRVGELYRKEIS